MSLRPGDEIGGFTIEAEAGRGGMGIVYRARQHQPARTVALKVMAPDLASDETFHARFRRESMVAARVEHPNVIPVYAVGEEDGTLFIAMRFVDGTDLRSVIEAEGRLEPHRAALIVEQVGEALDAAHRQGLVHRDVKPANILITTWGGTREHVYLTDFGLTREAVGGSELSMTGVGAFLGTIDYAAPEQARGDRIDARTDIYALGCVLFHALTGGVPFVAPNELAKLFAHVMQPPPTLRSRAPDVPAAFEPVVSRALAKAPEDRYPSAGDLGRAALAAAAGEAGSRMERSVAAGDAAPNINRGMGIVKPPPKRKTGTIAGGLKAVRPPRRLPDPAADDPEPGAS
jgi:serine/threonine protein kinase